MRGIGILVASLFVVAGTASAQTPPREPVRNDAFLTNLGDCLATRDATMHDCVVAYALAHEPTTSSFFSKVVGKYNTCFVYPVSESQSIEPTGYSCYSNSSGKCVSGECCHYVDTNC